MVSKMIRRSGVSVCTFAEYLNWQPDYVYQIGIGMRPEETDVMREAWPGIQFEGCEPHPHVAKHARKNYPGVVHEVAVSNFEGTATLYGKHYHKDGSSLCKHHIEGMEHELFEAKVTTLDALWPNPKGEKILLWLDCEGVELQVLEGGPNFLKRVEMINVETTPRPLGDGWCSPVAVHHWMMDNGFVRQHIHSQRSSYGQCDVIYVRPHLFQKKFCCCPCAIEDFEKRYEGKS